VGDLPRSVFSADFDSDGDKDLAVANRGCQYITVFMNNGDGTFADAINYGVGNNPNSVFSADIDGDDDFDLAVTNYTDDNVSILVNMSNITDVQREGIALSRQFPANVYPNPFNTSTTIQYSLGKPSSILVEIYDILGRKIDELTHDLQQAGNHQVTWNANSFPSGVYFYRIQGENYSNTGKMMLLK